MNNLHPTYLEGTVLIVDDTPANLRLLSQMLAKQGYKARVATNGPRALESAGANPPDLILLDILMPEMDGYQICEYLKANEQTRDIPVIFISALGDTEDKVRAFAVGGVDYVTKPFHTEEVLARVKTHLALQHAHRQLQAKNYQLNQEVVERKQAEEALARYAREMEALYDTSLEINIQLDISALLYTIVRRAVGLLDTHGGDLFLIQPDGETLKMVANYNRPDGNLKITLSLGEGVAGRVAQTGEPLIVADYENWAGWANDKSIIDCPKRILSVPLKRRDQVVGVLNVFGVKQIGEFSQNQVQLLQLFASQASIAIEKIELYEADRHQTEQLEALHQVSQDLATLHNLDTLLNQIVEHALKLSGREIAGISLYRPDREVLEWVVSVGESQTPVGLIFTYGEGVSGKVWAMGEPLIINNYQSWPGKSLQHLNLPIAVMGVPIQWGKEFLGVINIVDHTHPFNNEDALLLARFANQAAIAIHNTRLYEQAQQELNVRKNAEERLQSYSQQLEKMVFERVTELQDAQDKLARQEKLTVLGQLAGGVGHELRNPLGVISNAVYLLQTTDPEADEKTKEYLLGIIATRLAEAEKIVSDLLDFSRIKPANTEEVAVAMLIDEVLERYPPPEDVTVNIDLQPDLPTVFIDGQQLRQVLGNLITNACQAMSGEGSLTIRVGLAQNKVQIFVIDTGHGMSPETLKKIFEPLFTTKTQGIGLGLVVTKHLIETNGGSIAVKSEEGKGTTFTVMLPIKQRYLS